MLGPSLRPTRKPLTMRTNRSNNNSEKHFALFATKTLMRWCPGAQTQSNCINLATPSAKYGSKKAPIISPQSLT